MSRDAPAPGDRGSRGGSVVARHADPSAGPRSSDAGVGSSPPCRLPAAAPPRSSRRNPRRPPGLVPGPEFLSPASIGHEMDTPERVEAYLASQPEPKQSDLRQLHAHMLAEFPDSK